MEIGEVRYGSEIGIKPYKARFIWAACIYCGKERWVRCVFGKPIKTRCHNCYLTKDRRHLSLRYNAMEKNPKWKGGIARDHGYIRIKLSHDDFFYPMASKSGYVFEHRLIMARQLGRCLHPWELVHHKNHIRDDNRLENLQLVSDDRHKQITAMENRLNQLLAENKRLEKEISNLKGRRNEQ